MANAPRPLIAGNWKMNGLADSEAELVKIIGGSDDLAQRTDLMVCPPATLLARFASTAPNSVVAYEPVWAIGTGMTPTAADVAEVHALIRSRLKSRFGETGEEMRILYGGSVKPANAGELLGVAHVNGALVGGASLK